ASRRGTLFGGAKGSPKFFPSHGLRKGPFSCAARFTAYRLPRIWSCLPSTHLALRDRKSASLPIELRLPLVSCSFIDGRVNLERRQGRSVPGSDVSSTSNHVALTCSNHLVGLGKE